MREPSSILPLGLLLVLAVTTFSILGIDGQPTPSPTPTPQHHSSPLKGVLTSLHKPLDPPVFGVHLSQLPQQQANEVYKQSLDEINIKKVANTLADNYLKLQGQELSEALDYKKQNQNQAEVQSEPKNHPRRQPQQQKPVLTEVTPSTFVKFRDHEGENDQKKRSSLIKKPWAKTPQLLQTQARVVNDFHVKNKHPFALFNRTAAFLCNCNPADFAPIHSEEERERSFTAAGSEESSHYKVKRDDHANVAKVGGEENRRSALQGASQEIGRGGKRRPKDLVRKYRYSTLELKEDLDDDRPDVFFSDGFGSFDDFAKSFHGGSSIGGRKKVEGKFTPYSGEVDHGRQRHPGYSSLNSESHYSGHGGKHRTQGASYEDHRSSNEHGSANKHGGDEHLSGHKSIYTDTKPQSHYEEDSHQEHGQREEEYSHSNSKDVDFSKPRPSDVLRNPSHDYVDDHFQFEFDDESGHLRSSGKGSGSPHKEHGKFEQSHESHGSDVREQYRYSLFRGDHDNIQGGKHFTDVQHFAGPTSHGSQHHGKVHYSEHSDEDKHHYREPHHDDERHHASSHHGSSHHGSSHHDYSPHDKTPVYEYTPQDEGKHTPVSHEESDHEGGKSLGTITHYEPLVHHHPPIDHSRPHHGGGPSFGEGSRQGGGSHHEGDYDGEHHSDPHEHSSPVVESVKQVFNSEYYEKLAESLVSKMNDDQLMSMGGKSGKRGTDGHSPPSSGHQFGHGSREQYSPHGGHHHHPGGRHHFKRSDKSEQEKAALQLESQEAKNSNPAPTSFSSFQNPGKPLNSGGDNFHKEEDVRSLPEFRKNTDSRGSPHSHRDLWNSKSRETKFNSEEKQQRPVKSHFFGPLDRPHSGNFHQSNSVGPREPRSRPHFQITPNSISGPRHPPHFGSRAPNHNRSRSPLSNFNSQNLRNNPSHNPHLPPRPPTSFNGITPLGSTLMTLYNSIPTVNWSNRPMNRAPGPHPPPPGV